MMNWMPAYVCVQQRKYKMIHTNTHERETLLLEGERTVPYFLVTVVWCLCMRRSVGSKQCVCSQYPSVQQITCLSNHPSRAAPLYSILYIGARKQHPYTKHSRPWPTTEKNRVAASFALHNKQREQHIYIRRARISCCCYWVTTETEQEIDRDWTRVKV